MVYRFLLDLALSVVAWVTYRALAAHRLLLFSNEVVVADEHPWKASSSYYIIRGIVRNVFGSVCF